MAQKPNTNTRREAKISTYENLLIQSVGLLENENNLIANLANLSSMIHYSMGFWWTGFYLIDGDELLLGPFQGPVACTRIAKGKGACGKAWELNEIIVIPNVHSYPGHIACSAESNSEIVLPFEVNGSVRGVFDIDSDKLNNFDDTDSHFLGRLIKLLN